jgi:spore coat-associated protein S
LAIAANEPLDLVLGSYPIKVLDIRNESYKDKKGVWWIKTTDGMRILKKISNSEETLKFLLHAVDHLRKNGVLLPEIIKTSDGRNYAKVNGTCYVLTDAIDGKNPSYTSPRELNSIVGELAKFHKASQDFSLPAESKPKYHLGLWVEDYRAQLEEIDAWYQNELQKKEHDAIGKTLIKEFPYFYERANRAIEGLTGPEYREWVEHALHTGSLCHQDFAAGNLLMTAAGSIYVIDTDSITVDIAARDIRKLLNKIMKKAGRWDTELTRTILQSYQSVNPLTPSQWRVVKLDLLFPHLFLGAVNKYIYQRDKEWSAEKYHQRILEMAAFEKTLPPVMEHFERIIPK